MADVQPCTGKCQQAELPRNQSHAGLLDYMTHQQRCTQAAATPLASPSRPAVMGLQVQKGASGRASDVLQLSATALAS